MKTIILLFLCFHFAFSQKSIEAEGNSFSSSIYLTWAKYYKKRMNVDINYKVSSSEEGLKKIESKSIDFLTLDSPLESEKLDKLKLIQFPSVIGGIAPIINLYGIEEDRLKLGQDILAKIYLEEIKTWDDPRIKKDNPTLKLPSAKINFAYQSNESGSTVIFTKYLSKSYLRYENIKVTGQIYRNDQEMADYIRKTANSIGYVNFSFAKKNNLVYAQVQNQSGSFVSPNTESFKSAANYAKWNSENHFNIWLVNAPGDKSWPITSASFILLAKNQSDSNKKVKDFFDWCFTKGGKTALSLSYVPLPSSLKNQIKTYWGKHLKE
jgi:phosphate transport system substrate-binding protein